MIDFPKLLQTLTEAGVEFIIVGGAAAAAHGATRLTNDLDLVYRRTPENHLLLAEALAPFSPYPRDAPKGLPFQWDERTLRMGLNFTLATTLGSLDLLGEITGGGKYEDLLPFTEKIQLFGIECNCLNLKKLIEVKRAAGRPKDFDAIAELEAIWEEKDQ
jgi:predicted nucleotidyltransferase